MMMPECPVQRANGKHTRRLYKVAACYSSRVLKSANLQLLKSHLRVEAGGAQDLGVKRSAVPSLLHSFKLQRLLLARLLRKKGILPIHRPRRCRHAA